MKVQGTVIFNGNGTMNQILFEPALPLTKCPRLCGIREDILCSQPWPLDGSYQKAGFIPRVLCDYQGEVAVIAYGRRLISMKIAYRHSTEMVCHYLRMEKRIPGYIQRECKYYLEKMNQAS